MNYIGKIISNLGQAYSEINPATLTGAIDVIIVEQEDGSFKCSPFHVRFGKMGVIRSKEKIVDIEINGIPVDIHMKLGDSGEAYFLEECDEEDGEDNISLVSPSSSLPSSPVVPSSTSQTAEEALSTAVQSPSENDVSKTKDDNGAETALETQPQQPAQPLCDSPIKAETVNHCDNNQVADKETAIQSSEAANAEQKDSLSMPAPAVAGIENVVATPKSDSVTSVNVSVSSDRSTNSQKRYRRKKKNRASSKPSLTSVSAESTKVSASEQQSSEQSSSCVELDDGGGLKSAEKCETSSVNHQYNDGELHPFSDSEVGHITHHIYKKQESVDPYDCKSDSEYEIFKSNTQTGPENAHDNISWDWGELPNVSAAAAQKEMLVTMAMATSNGSASKKESLVEGAGNKEKEAGNKSPRSSMLGGVLGYIIKENKETTTVNNANNNNNNSNALEEDKGIYLDDLDPNDMNPEVAAKYFPKFSPNPNSSSHFMNQSANRSSHTSDEDVESGTGPSLSNSPHSTEYNYPTTRKSGAQALSLPDFADFDISNTSAFDLFTFSKLYHDMSMSLCGGIENLVDNPGDTEHFLQSIISFDDFGENPLAIINNPNLVVRMGGKYFTWKMASAVMLSLLMFQRPLPETTLTALKEQCIPKKKITAQNSTSSWRNWSIFRSNASESSQTAGEGGQAPDSVDGGQGTRSHNSSSSEENSNSNSSGKLGSGSPTKTLKNLNNSLEYTSDEDTMNIVLGSNKTSTTTTTTAATSTNTTESSTAASTPLHSGKKVKYRKVLRLKSDIVKSLNLKQNCNDVMFSVTTAFQGTTICRSQIFLWRYDDKVVISDIDGTITKSDVLGHILPYIGKDWAQLGVTQLFTNIEYNSYKFLYLSARAIGQAKTTREYLRDLRQDGIGLPDGPLLLSPTSLFSALHREVIEKKPEEFKISCLRDIQSLFPENPFFAGFGNKINDCWAYKAVGIDSSRIFTINHKGELKLDKIMSFKSSYTDLSQFVDQMFPPLQKTAGYDGYSSFMFWRPDIPELNETELSVAKD